MIHVVLVGYASRLRVLNDRTCERLTHRTQLSSIAPIPAEDCHGRADHISRRKRRRDR